MCVSVVPHNYNAVLENDIVVHVRHANILPTIIVMPLGKKSEWPKISPTQSEWMTNEPTDWLLGSMTFQLWLTASISRKKKTKTTTWHLPNYMTHTVVVVVAAAAASVVV